MQQITGYAVQKIISCLCRSLGWPVVYTHAPSWSRLPMSAFLCAEQLTERKYRRIFLAIPLETILY